MRLRLRRRVLVVAAGEKNGAEQQGRDDAGDPGHWCLRFRWFAFRDQRPPAGPSREPWVYRGRCEGESRRGGLSGSYSALIQVKQFLLTSTRAPGKLLLSTSTHPHSRM